MIDLIKWLCMIQHHQIKIKIQLLKCFDLEIHNWITKDKECIFFSVLYDKTNGVL